jgi:hypothetical protein
MDFTALEREASSRTEYHWSFGVSGYGASGGGGQKSGSSNQSGSNSTQQTTNSSVQVVFKEESAPGNTTTKADLETKIRDAKNWTIFPVVGVQKEHFTQVYEIMKMQAEETGDTELGKVSDIFRLHMKG